jgi:hypothetical protein
MAVFQRMIEIAKQADDIWIGTRSEAVKYILAQQQGAVPRAARA